jgi:hypothetical protein
MSNVINNSEADTVDWYQPGKSIAEFHASKAPRRFLVGARGTGKTFSCMLEAVNHCLHNAGAEVRIFRKFSSSNEDSVIPSLKEVFSKLSPTEEENSLFKDTGLSLFQWRDGGARVRVPSYSAVEAFEKWKQEHPGASISETQQWLDTVGDRLCGRIVLDGLPDDDKAAAKIRSSQVSMLIFVEADGIAEDHVRLAEGSLRKRDAFGNFFPKDEYSIILETNPPGKKHWMAVWENGDADNGKLPEPDCAWWHIPAEENAHNMRPGYVDDLKRTYANDPCGYNKFVLGLYDDVFPGTAVIKGFSYSAHVRKNVPWPHGAWLIRGWDYGGSNNTCVWLAYFVGKDGYERIWALKELWLQNSSVEQQANEVKKITEEEFPVINEEGLVAGIYDFGDVAGGQKSATGSVVDVLATHGIFPGSSKLGVEASLAILDRLMEARDDQGRPLFIIDELGCPKLLRALKGEYRYPLPGEPGYGAPIQKPLKGPACNNADHVVDAFRYGVANMFRLLKVGAPNTAKKNRKPNPKRIPR